MKMHQHFLTNDFWLNFFCVFFSCILIWSSTMMHPSDGKLFPYECYKALLCIVIVLLLWVIIFSPTPYHGHLRLSQCVSLFVHTNSEHFLKWNELNDFYGWPFTLFLPCTLIRSLIKLCILGGKPFLFLYECQQN